MASYDRAIPPGGVGKITIKVRTAGYHGRITKSALVKSNDPRRRNTRLTITAVVKAPIVIDPASRVILRGVVGDDLRKVLHLRAGDHQPLEINGIQTDLQRWLSWNIRSRQDGRVHDLEVVYNKEAGETSVSGHLQLLTNHPRKREVTIPVHIRVRPEVEVIPSIVDFGRVSKRLIRRQRLKRTLMVVNNRGRGIRLKELLYNQDYFVVHQDAFPGSNPPCRYRLQVLPRLDNLPPGYTSDVMVIKTDKQELKVRLEIQVRENSG